MDSLSPPETRGRSRSKTPFLRSSCDREMCSHAGEGHFHERKKSPLVQTIIEEYVEESRPGQRVHVTKQSSKAVATSDYSSADTSPDTARARYGGQSAVTVTKTHSFSTSRASNSFDKRSPASQQSSFSMQASGAAVRSKEISQNELNSAFERSQSIQTSTPISSASRKTQLPSVSNGDLSNHIAYKEYKEAGEYWKKFPKTDYTYSKLSPHRRELAPGVVAMPNMSRPSLEKHQERVNYMVHQNPGHESYIRKRYETTRYQQTQAYSQAQSLGLGYDSQDEVDSAEMKEYRKSRHYMQARAVSSAHHSSFITRILTGIVTVFNNFLSLFSSDEDSLHYTRIEKNQGFLGRTRHAISSAILGIFRYVYLLISSVMYLDTWLLRSSSPDNRSKKRFLLFLLLLLPLLLLAGVHYYLNPPETFPPKPFYQMSLPVSSLNLSEYVNSKQIEHLKVSAFEKIDDLRTWSEDYFTYLRTVSHNVLTEAHKIWLENFN